MRLRTDFRYSIPSGLLLFGWLTMGVLGCTKTHDYTRDAEGTYVLERQTDRQAEKRDTLSVEKIDPSHIRFAFKVFVSTSPDYIDTDYDGMTGSATLKESEFIYSLPMKIESDTRKCFLEFVPEKDAIDLRITPECESWHTPNGKWIKK